MTVVLVSALCSMLIAAAPGEDAFDVRYTGALTRVTRPGEEPAGRKFGVYFAVGPRGGQERRVGFAIDNQGAGATPWSGRIGEIALTGDDRPAGPGGPTLLYTHNGVPQVVALPLPLPPLAGDLKVGAKWSEGRAAWEVVREQKVLERNCWQFEGSTGQGAPRSAWFDAKDRFLVAYEQQVILGEGVEYTLTLQLATTTPLDEARFAQIATPLRKLLDLEKQFRPASGPATELTEADLNAVSAAMPAIEREAKDTPLAGVTSAIAKEVKLQLRRADELQKLAARFVGSSAPALVFKPLDGPALDRGTLQGKIVVLHFWEYQGEPLVEPYGQVGYLEFLYGKRRKLGVQVLGVAVDGRLRDAQTAPLAARSVRKLKSFMNLEYPIVGDDGTLLEKFGDPRQAGAKLPLWVVIGPDGKIAHYASGYYPVNADEGLRELDAAVIKLIKEQKNRAGE